MATVLSLEPESSTITSLQIRRRVVTQRAIRSASLQQITTPLSATVVSMDALAGIATA
jgi:hypothetical protein